MTDAYAPIVWPDHLPPQLLLVVDVEEEFDWRAPFRRDGFGVSNVFQLARIEDICEPLGLTPLYVMSFPILDSDRAMVPLGQSIAAGRALPGIQLHGWVTPPFEEMLSARHSYQLNLPRDLEQQKLERLLTRATGVLGTAPQMHKAGRYGYGPGTADVLQSLGLHYDLSPNPGFDFRADGGPDFRHMTSHVRWLDDRQKILQLPTTGGFSGLAKLLGPALYSADSKRLLEFLRVESTLSRLGLIERVRLSPEGYSLAEMCRLAKAQLRAGVGVLSVSLHSSSLLPGATPFVADTAERDGELKRLGDFLTWAQDALGAEPSTPGRVRALLSGSLSVNH